MYFSALTEFSYFEMKALKGQMHDDVICENYQNPSVCSFLVQISGIVS